jgi:hypothetical protein
VHKVILLKISVFGDLPGSFILKVEIAHSSKMLVLIHEFTHCHISEDGNINIQYHEVLRYRNSCFYINCACIKASNVDYVE